MLLKADKHDDYSQALALWRAMIPFWNTEADRFRAAAHAASRTRAVSGDLVAQAEDVMGRVRGALLACDTLVVSAAPGDQRLPLLLSAAADFEALLESLHRSLELMAAYVRPPSRVTSARHVGPSFASAVSKPF